MQKKTMVLAVAAAFVLPSAFAKDKPEPDSVVELYGKIYPEIVVPTSKGATGTDRATGANAASYCTICLKPTGENSVIQNKTEMESSNSRLGVRGHEKLGPDLKAIFQLETEFHVDSNDSAFARRDSFVGLAHKRWGTVKLGRMDTPFKQYGDDVSFLGISSGNFVSTSGVFRHIGMGSQNNAARFHERRVNAIGYESPDLGPVDFQIQWSTNETDTASPPRKPHVLSMGARFEHEWFEVYGGYEEHKDLFGISLNVPSAMRNNTDPNVRSKDTATEIGIKFKWRKHEFAFEGNQKKYDEPGATATGKIRSYKNNGYLFAWDARWSQQWRTAFHYVKATPGSCSRVNAECNTNGLKGEQISFGVSYYFSKKTFLFFIASRVKNDFAASFNGSNQQDISPGEDLQQIAVGLHTAF